jgi:predicted ATP-dependent endonuclease of OLD family
MTIDIKDVRDATRKAQEEQRRTNEENAKYIIKKIENDICVASTRGETSCTHKSRYKKEVHELANFHFARIGFDTKLTHEDDGVFSLRVSWNDADLSQPKKPDR